MHSYHWGAPDKKWVHFHHNGDFSGDVVVVLPDKIAKLEISPEVLANNQTGTVAVRIPFKAMQALVMNYVRGRAIEQFEEMTDKQVEQWLIDMIKREEASEQSD